MTGSPSLFSSRRRLLIHCDDIPRLRFAEPLTTRRARFKANGCDGYGLDFSSLPALGEMIETGRADNAVHLAFGQVRQTVRSHNENPGSRAGRQRVAPEIKLVALDINQSTSSLPEEGVLSGTGFGLPAAIVRPSRHL